MSRLKFFASLCIGLFVYTILIITLGQNGVWAYNQLEIQKDALTENVSRLQSINENLTVDYQSLEQDDVRIKALAHKLGYVSDGEILVKITGISDRGTKVYDCGTVYRTTEIQYIEEHVCKLMGVIFFVISLLLFCVTDLKKSRQISCPPAAATVVTIVSR